MLYFRYIGMLLRSTLQYRLSFLLTVIGQFFNTFFEFAAMFLLFSRFGQIAGYTLGEVALCFAVAHASFSIADCFFRGFDTFSRKVVSGDFDRILVRPQPLVLQVLGSDFELARVGRLIECAAVLILAVLSIETAWTPARALMVALMVLGGTGIYSGIFILGAALSFITIQGLEVVNILSDGGRELAAYPINIYNKWIQRFFTFIIPFGCINYLPLHYILGRVDNPLYLLLPLAGVVFLLPCVALWYWGVTKYVSTGS